MSTTNKINYIKTGLWIISSITSSVGLILTNKVIMGRPFNFVYVFTLTSIHFFVTAFTMELMAIAGFFYTQSASMDAFADNGSDVFFISRLDQLEP